MKIKHTVEVTRLIPPNKKPVEAGELGTLIEATKIECMIDAVKRLPGENHLKLTWKYKGRIRYYDSPCQIDHTHPTYITLILEKDNERI